MFTNGIFHSKLHNNIKNTKKMFRFCFLIKLYFKTILHTQKCKDGAESSHIPTPSSPVFNIFHWYRTYFTIGKLRLTRYYY